MFAPYYGAKILAKTGYTERTWFFILAFFNIWALLIVFVRPSFQKGLKGGDLQKLILLALSYPVIFGVLILFLNSTIER